MLKAYHLPFTFPLLYKIQKDLTGVWQAHNKFMREHRKLEEIVPRRDFRAEIRRSSGEMGELRATLAGGAAMTR